MKTYFDSKTILIIILGMLLVFFIFFKKPPMVETHEMEIKKLQKENKLLKNNNDSLKVANFKLDGEIGIIRAKLTVNEKVLNDTQKQLDKLNKRRNETSIKVNGLSANGVASSLSDYLERTKGSNSN
jgi:hypothetical protein